MMWVKQFIQLVLKMLKYTKSIIMANLKAFRQYLLNIKTLKGPIRFAADNRFNAIICTKLGLTFHVNRLLAGDLHGI